MESHDVTTLHGYVSAVRHTPRTHRQVKAVQVDISLTPC